MAELRARRAFVPVVVVGLASAALSAVAGNQPWATAEGAAGSAQEGLLTVATSSTAGESPASGALALVVLASWGVVLVSRGRFRRAVSVLGFLAAASVLVTVGVGYDRVTGSLESALADLGAADPEASLTGWYWVAAAAALVSVIATAIAMRLVPAWPEMGRRYDAPSGPPTRPDPAVEDPWRALDEGRDPTT